MNETLTEIEKFVKAWHENPFNFNLIYFANNVGIIQFDGELRSKASDLMTSNEINKIIESYKTSGFFIWI